MQSVNITTIVSEFDFGPCSCLWYLCAKVVSDYLHVTQRLPML